MIIYRDHFWPEHWSKLLLTLYPWTPYFSRIDAPERVKRRKYATDSDFI